MSSSGKETSFKIQEPGRKLKPSEVDFMKLIEKENLQRVQKLQNLRRRNNLTGLILGGSVLSIYLYSMLSIKQEKFLDDFNEPLKVSNE
ncbi:hypothetical protein HA402_012744 [Bradysia odoriphaga]|nr:hypothetical protein HA402_012744 [Bradysia odoriphaga]